MVEPVRVNLVVGPGHHGPLMLQALRAHGIHYRAMLQWPELTVEQWRGGGAPESRSSRWYGWQRRLTWAAWRRLPYFKRFQTPRQLDCVTFDWAARREIDGGDVLVGWSQVSLRSLERARELAMPTVLEHPMTHVSTWARLMDEEYSRWPHGRERYNDLPRLLMARMRREYQTADYISVLSSFAAKTFVDEGVAERRLLRLPLGVDVERFTPPAQPRRDGPLRLLYVGRLELLKGIPYLLQAVRGLAGVELTLAGWVLPEIESVLRQFDAPFIHLLGQRSAAELPELYRAADVLLFPSVNDAMGLVLLEAMACGLPVVASENSGAPDIVDEGVDGFVVPARNVEALRQRIVELRDDPERRLAMGVAARQKVLARYREPDYAARLVAALRLVGSGG